jgi:hypothetical protein
MISEMISKMVMDIRNQQDEVLENMIQDFLKCYPELTVKDIEIVEQEITHVGYIDTYPKYIRDRIYYIRKKKDV